jgi:hypothetical protein
MTVDRDNRRRRRPVSWVPAGPLNARPMAIDAVKLESPPSQLASSKGKVVTSLQSILKVHICIIRIKGLSCGVITTTRLDRVDTSQLAFGVVLQRK